VAIGSGVFEAEAGSVVGAEPKLIPDLTFEDGDGNSLRLSDFRGRLVLLNVWATWCAPCREELPSLNRLQAILGGPDIAVVALSVDRGGVEPVKRFLSAIGVQNLPIYLDRTSASLVDSGILGIPISTSPSKGSLGVFGIPTTLLIDREGRELGRLIGPTEWDSPQMITLIQRQFPREQRNTR